PRGRPSSPTRRSSDLDGYRSSLDWSLRHGVIVLLALAGVMAATVGLYASLDKEALPQQDTGQIRGFVRGDDGFSFQVMQPKIERSEEHTSELQSREKL